MKITRPISPALFAEIQAAVSDYARTMGVSEAESWAVLEQRIGEEFSREVARRLDAEARALEERMLYGSGEAEPRGILNL